VFRAVYRNRKLKPKTIKRHYRSPH